MKCQEMSFVVIYSFKRFIAQYVGVQYVYEVTLY